MAAKLPGTNPHQFNIIQQETIEKEKRIHDNHVSVKGISGSNYWKGESLFSPEEIKELSTSYFGKRTQPSVLKVDFDKSHYDQCHHMRDKYVLKPKRKRDDRSDHLEFGVSFRKEEQARIVPCTYSQWYGHRPRVEPIVRDFMRQYSLKKTVYRGNGTSLQPVPGNPQEPVTYTIGVFEHQKRPLAMELLPSSSKLRLDPLTFRPLKHF